MPATLFHRGVLTLGFLSLFHAAYSAAQRKYQVLLLGHYSTIKIFFRSILFEIK